MPKERDFKTMIGGQALIEGIMMRGPKKQSIVVRSPDGLVEKVEPIKLVKDRYPILGLPLIRGAVSFIDSMVHGVKALMYSAEFYPEDESDAQEPGKFDKWIEEHFSVEAAQKIIIYVAVFIGIAFSVGLFMLLPTVLTSLFTGIITNRIVRNLIEGVIRIGIFTIYIVAVSQMKDMRRVYSYHGAEHKTIACYESGLPLTVENVRPCSRFHPRCGTSFMFVVLFISILVFAVVSWSNVWIRMVFRILLLPVVVGISYEINRYVGRHNNSLTKILTAPGLFYQRFTTNEPDDSMIEVAIAAINLVLPDNEGEDAW